MDIKVLIRFDDICPTMNWEQWSIAEKLLDKYNIKPIIGVIPDCQDPDLMIDQPRQDFWKWVREKQRVGYTVAMHGHTHTFVSPNRGILNYRMNSEFAGLTYEEQLEKIKKGKEILESNGIQTDIFIAPAHSYDENTIKALAACGFRYVSDGKSSKAYVWHELKFLPCRNYGSARVKNKKHYTSIYHAHEWLRQDKYEDYKLLCDLVKDKTNLIVGFNQYCQQPVGITYIQRFVEWMYVRYERYLLPVLRQAKTKVLK